MLKTISPLIGGELLKILDEMGHGDEIVIADGNFPGGDIAKRMVRLSGQTAVPLLKGVLKLFPLDTFVASPVTLMEKPKEDAAEPAIWREYRSILSEYPHASIEHLERFAFYERAKRAYAVIATSEPALCANIILKKGVVAD